MIDLDNIALESIIGEAWYRGNCINLTGVGYGPAHWSTDEIVDSPYDYYYLLAGLVNITNVANIIEIGTHYGGSALAMSKGLSQYDNSKILTFDVTDIGINKFKDHRVIKACQLNANTELAYNKSLKEFDTIDLLFIDSYHEYWTTFLSLQIYTSFMPSWVIIDDITLNDDMKKLWDKAVDRYGAKNCINATTVIPEFRPMAGFGIIYNRDRR